MSGNTEGNPYRSSQEAHLEGETRRALRGLIQRGCAFLTAALVTLGVLFAAAALAESIPAPAPASGLNWADTPNDAGRSVELEWKLSPDDSLANGRVAGYLLVESQTGHVQEPGYVADISSTVGQYKINPPLSDSLFEDQ